MEKWIVFYNRETGEEYASYTYRGTFKGEEEATRDFEEKTAIMEAVAEAMKK